MEDEKTSEENGPVPTTTPEVMAIQEDPIDTRCGVGPCKPSWLQKLATIQSFVGFNAVSNLFTFSLKMILVSQVTTIEKRFGFTSSLSGFIISSSQITFLVFILFFSHFARASHIPRILSVCSVIAGLSGLMFAAAQLLPIQGSPGESSAGSSSSGQSNLTGGNSAGAPPQVCHSDNATKVDNCESEADVSLLGKSALAIFLVAQLIQGVVTSPRSPLGGTYVDDNNPIPTSSGKYIGIMLGVTTLAPVLSFGIGALSSGIYHTLEETTLTPRDPRWIGAWWLGFFVLGIMTILTATIIFFFPRRLEMPAGMEKHDGMFKEKLTKLTEEKVDKSDEKSKTIIQKITGPFVGIFRVLRSPVFTMTVLSSTLHAFALLGMASFIPKYLETQFYIPAFKANIMLGVISLLGSTLGPICGGIVTARYKLTTSGNLKLVLVVCILLTIGCPIGMLLAGEQTTLVKSNLPGAPGQIGPVSSCVTDCFCPDESMLAVCGSDGVTYYSPCHAGCHGEVNRTYTDCACANGTAVSGFCAEEDQQVYILLLYSTMTSFVLTFSLSSQFMIFVRSVSVRDKALALGLSSFVSTLLGHFPGPIVYGKLVDTTCLLWQEGCSGQGACALYDLAGLRYKIYGTNMGLFFLAAVCILIALLIHRRTTEYELTSLSYETVEKDPSFKKVEQKETVA